MALQITITENTIGINSTYHVIVGTEKSYIPDPFTPGSKGTVAIRIASYVSQAARTAGADPINTRDAMFRFGATLTGYGNIASDEPMLADDYTALKTTPTFTGAADA